VVVDASRTEHVVGSGRDVVIDLNNLLTVIRGYSEFLSEDLPGSPEEVDDLRELDRARQMLAGSVERAKVAGLLTDDDRALLLDEGTLLQFDGEVPAFRSVLAKVWGRGCSCGWCSRPNPFLDPR
jgi:hypothetical protein